MLGKFIAGDFIAIAGEMHLFEFLRKIFKLNIYFPL
jgi:hypothetical protein